MTTELEYAELIASIMEKHPEANTVREAIEREASQLRDLSLDLGLWCDRMHAACRSLQSVIATGLYVEHRGKFAVLTDNLESVADSMSRVAFRMDATLDDAGVPELDDAMFID